MCVVDRARRAPFLPHPCPISTDFDSRPKLERETVACRLLPVPSRLNSHACIEAAKHLLHLLPLLYQFHLLLLHCLPLTTSTSSPNTARTPGKALEASWCFQSGSSPLPNCQPPHRCLILVQSQRRP